MSNLTNVSGMLDRMRSGFTPEQNSIYNYYNLLGEISARIVEYRMVHGLTQGQLAERLRITQGMVSRYESGEYNFSLKTLNDLCSSLGLELSVRLEDGGAMTIGGDSYLPLLDEYNGDASAA